MDPRNIPNVSMEHTYHLYQAIEDNISAFIRLTFEAEMDKETIKKTFEYLNKYIQSLNEQTVKSIEKTMKQTYGDWRNPDKDYE